MKTASDIDREAAEWVARRDAAPDPDTMPEGFDAWLAADVRHRAAYLRLNAAWERSLLAEKLRPLRGPIDRNLLAPPQATTARRLRWMAAAAALVILGVGVAVWLPARSGEKVYSTGVGSLERIILGDGSTVDLNTDSEIAVQMSAQHRLVTLRRGEAHFRVARDPQRPFEVLGGGRRVRAVGTAFLVRLRSATHAEVLVTEGRVVITPASASTQGGTVDAPLIVAGEVATVDRDRFTVQRVSSATVTSRLAWTDGKIVLIDAPLSEAVAQFNRYNSVQLVVGDPALESLRVGGTFDAGDVPSFVAALHRIFAIQAQQPHGNAVRLVREPGAAQSRATSD